MTVIFKKLKPGITATLIIIISLSSASFAMEQKELVKGILKGKSPLYETAIDYIKVNLPPQLPVKLKEEYLDDDDREIRGRIISALKLYPPEEIAPVWVEVLRKTSSAPLETEIIDYLGRSRHFTQIIAEKLLAPMSEVREKAARTLKNSGDDRILPVILNLAKSGNPIDRIYLLEALNHLYDLRFQKLVISLLSDENKSVRIYAIKCAMDNDIKESVQGIKRLVTTDDNDEVRKRAILALAYFRDTGSGSIIASVLKEGKKDLTLAAIKALRDLRYSGAAVQISEILMSDSDPEMKSAAIDALCGFGRAGNIEGLKRIITADQNPLMRVRGVYALGEVSEEKATLEILTTSLSDSDYRVRGEGCSALGKLRKSRTSAILLNQIRTDSSRYVRSAALYSLQKIKESRDIVPLFDIYSVEGDSVFRELLRSYLRSSLVKLIR